MQRTIALFGSSRRNGNTGKLIDEIAARLNIEVVDLAQKDISPYDYEHRNRHDDFEPLMEHVLEHDQIIFASPVYWYAVCPQMKVFLDRVTDLLELPDLLEKGRQLSKKSGYVAATSIYDDIPEPFIGAFRLTFDYLGMRFGGQIHANCESGYIEGAYERDVAAFVERVQHGLTHNGSSRGEPGR